MPQEYGEKYQDHLLEQYKLYVQTSQQVSEKRQNSNNYLLTLNSSLVTLFVVFLSTFGHNRWNALLPATGLIVCFIWYSLVDSYKDLNTAKFAVITSLRISFPWRCSAMNGGCVDTTGRRKTGQSRTSTFRSLIWNAGYRLRSPLYVGLGAYALLARVEKKDTQQQPTQQQAQPGPDQQKQTTPAAPVKP